MLRLTEYTTNAEAPPKIKMLSQNVSKFVKFSCRDIYFWSKSFGLPTNTVAELFSEVRST